jgi:hypothetical protein
MITNTAPLLTDPNLQTATERLDDAQRILDAALALHAELPPLEKGTADVDLDRLEDRRRLKRAREGVAEATHVLDVAMGIAKTRFLAARAPGRVQRLRALLAATEAAQAAARALHDFDTETASPLGLQPRLPPCPSLLELGDGLVRLRRELDGPPPSVPVPVHPSQVRVQPLKPFLDREGRHHAPDYHGMPLGPVDVDADVAEIAIREKWAEAVDA